MLDSQETIVIAGIPAINQALYHQIRFSVGDPAALIHFASGERLLILRDIEMDRARQHARVDRVACPADFAPAEGLSGDRETATAQSVAECLRREGVARVTADRTLPLIFADALQRKEISIHCDLDLGVTQRRHKDEQEIAWLAQAQSVTEGAIELACRMIGGADCDAAGQLLMDGSPLTPDRVRAAVDIWLLERNFQGPTWIVAGGPEGSDCHHHGSAALRTGQPIIVDIFPQDRATRYHGDCTRTVVHGEIPEEVQRMHAAVVAAKAEAIAACRPGVTGEDVHAVTSRVLQEKGYAMGLPPQGAPDDHCSMPHGTGHGIGLEVHEPPLLDRGGPALVVGDALTVEPGLYAKSIGGIRVEDLVIVEPEGCRNLNRLPEGLQWP